MNTENANEMYARAQNSNELPNAETSIVDNSILNEERQASSGGSAQNGMPKLRRNTRNHWLEGAEDKQVLIENSLGQCSQSELAEILALMTESDPHEDWSRLRLLRALREILDTCVRDEDKIDIFLRLMSCVPPHMTSNIASIIQTGAEASTTKKPALTSPVSPQSSCSKLEVADLAKSSLLRKEFKIEGKLGREKSHMSLITLKGQIDTGKKRGYPDDEICDAIKRAVAPSDLKTILDSMPDLTLEKVLTFLESALKEKSSSELFHELSTSLVQRDNEDAQSFLMRALELRQRCLLVSEKPGEVPYERALVQMMFLKSLRLGLKNSDVKARLEAFLARAGDQVEECELITAMNTIASEEAERACKRANVARIGEHTSVAAMYGAVSNGRRDMQISANPQRTTPKEQIDVQETVKLLSEQIAEMSKQMSTFQKNATTPAKQSNNSPANTKPAAKNNFRFQWYSCDACKEAKKSKSCRHCWQCGASDHQVRDCPASN